MKYLFLISAFCLSGLLLAQEDTSRTIFQLLQQDSILYMHFTTDLKQLNQTEKEEESHPASLTLGPSPSADAVWNVDLEQRGKLRRKICLYKPLKIKFSKTQLAGKGLDAVNLKSIKMVLNCKGDRSGDLQVLKEYLAYRLYNILTEKSFRVQLLHITFEDSLDRSQYQSYGFLIEPDKELGLRNLAGVTETKGITARNVVEKEYLLMAVFEYMIANSDWKMDVAHNVIFLRKPGKSMLSPVPYDFDFSGLVDASYASPNSSLPIKKVTERLFMGSYNDEAILDEVLQVFDDKRVEMEDLVLNFNHLTEKERERTWKYLDQFFQAIRKRSNAKFLFPKETVYQDIMELDKVKKNPKKG